MLQEKSRPPSPPPPLPQQPLAHPHEGTEGGRLIEQVRAEICLLKEEIKEEMKLQMRQQTRMILSELVTLSGHGPVVSVT